MAVLLFITSLVIFVFHFMPAPKIARFESGLDQAPIQGQAQNLTISPNDRSVKIRRKVSYLSPPSSPSVQTSRPIHDRDAQLIRRVLVPKLFSYAVVQQPESNPYYVSSSKELVTEFSLAREFNNIGLLAHNNLAGKSFKHLKPGQDIYVVHKNGHTDRYIVSNIYRFQALESTNTGSRFVDLDTGENLTANEVFTKMYAGVPHLTFQTCIYAEGDSSWGRLFVIAVPDEDTN